MTAPALHLRRRERVLRRIVRVVLCAVLPRGLALLATWRFFAWRVGR